MSKYYPNCFKLPADEIGVSYVLPNRYKQELINLWRQSRRPDLLGYINKAPNYLPIEEARKAKRNAFYSLLYRNGFCCYMDDDHHMVVDCEIPF